MCDCTPLSCFYTYKLTNCTSVRITISDWRTGTHWDVGQSINDDTIQLLSVSLIILRPIQREWPGSNWTLNSHRTKKGEREVASGHSFPEQRGAAEVNVAVSGAKGEWWMMRRRLDALTNARCSPLEVQKSDIRDRIWNSVHSKGTPDCKVYGWFLLEFNGFRCLMVQLLQ